MLTNGGIGRNSLSKCLTERTTPTTIRNQRTMALYDISVTLSPVTPTYPGDPAIEITPALALARGNSANVSLLNFSAHSGTHIDAPAHLIAGGEKVDSIPLETLIGEVAVIEVSDGLDAIDAPFVAKNCIGIPNRVLFKTRNSTFWNNAGPTFRINYTYLEPSAAEELVERGYRLVGIDYLSVDKSDSQNLETHRILLSRNVVILEGLDLRQVPSGTYELICLPLRIAGELGDGAPARAVLRSISNPAS